VELRNHLLTEDVLACGIHLQAVKRHTCNPASSDLGIADSLPTTLRAHMRTACVIRWRRGTQG
jgi:hypothetical protein